MEYVRRSGKTRWNWAGEAGSVAVLPWRYAPMGPGSIPSPGIICAFGFQSILASAGFLRVLQFSLLHLKLDFLNKSVSGHHIEASLEFNAFALLGFAWFSAKINKEIKKYKQTCKKEEKNKQMKFFKYFYLLIVVNYDMIYPYFQRLL